MSRLRRRVDPAVAAARAAERAAARADSFDNAPPRRPMHGHTADCPDRLKGFVRLCRFCRGEALGQHRVNGVPVPPQSVLAGGGGLEERGALQGRQQGKHLEEPRRRHLVAVPDPRDLRIAIPELVEREPELRSCRGCCAPTTADLCPKCEASG